MVRSDRSRYAHFNVASRWRIWVMDEPNDIVIGIDYLDAPHPIGKWKNVAHLDETKHEFYHAHIPPDLETRIPIGSGLSREDKLCLGFELLAKFAEGGKIVYNNETMNPSELQNGVLEQVLERKAKLGSTHHNVSIGGTARIVQNPDPPSVKS